MLPHQQDNYATMPNCKKTPNSGGSTGGGLIELSPPPKQWWQPPIKSGPFRGLKSAKRQCMPKLHCL